MRSLRVALLVALVVVIVAPATPVAADDAVVTNNERRQALLHRDWPDDAAPGALLVTTVDAERARAVARAEHGRLLSERVVLVDLYNGLGGTPAGSIGVDGLHPTETGYTKIANIWFEAIQHEYERQTGSSTTPAPTLLRRIP